MKIRTAVRPVALAAALAAGAAHLAAHAATLEGWALMPANTFADGPTSGQFAGAGAGGNSLPLLDKQPVQGFSGVLEGARKGSFRVMTDNGFGAQGNSADTLLRVYGVTPDFRTAAGGTGAVSAADYATGKALPAFSAASRLTLADPDRKLRYTIQAGLDHYYDNPLNPKVDASIKAGRLLTGADLDLESMRQDKDGNLWFGDEFGPFLVKTDATGKVLKAEFELPGVKAPQNPYLAGGTPNLGGSRGFEGMAINKSGDTLYTLLEGTVAGDVAKSLRINEFSIDAEAYTGRQWFYQLEAEGTAIGDMTAIGDGRFLVIERNGATATGGGTPFKKIFIADLRGAADGSHVKKTELVDLMNIADPHDLDRDGSTTFTFPFVTIENVLMLDRHTLLVINDNNYPFTGGRNPGSDNTEFLKLHLAQPVPEPATLALMAGGLAAVGAVTRRRLGAARMA